MEKKKIVVRELLTTNELKRLNLVKKLMDFIHQSQCSKLPLTEYQKRAIAGDIAIFKLNLRFISKDIFFKIWSLYESNIRSGDRRVLTYR